MSYHWTPSPVNVYWTALTFLDLLVAVLFVFRLPFHGMLLAVAIMISNVAVSSYTTYVLYEADFFSNISLQVQTLFLVFLLATVPLAWKKEEPYSEN